MTDLLRSLIVRRGTVAADILLDCLALAEALDECCPDVVPRQIALSDLRHDWWCRSNSEVLRRMTALQVAELVEVTYYSGRNAYWEVHRVGPVV